MAFIGKKVEPFRVQAYYNGAIVPITEADLLGKWSVLFFYPADFTFV
jgi:peroxiredoxin (alkyl hydroperoxide reductase subunit C)